MYEFYATPQQELLLGNTVLKPQHAINIPSQTAKIFKDAGYNLNNEITRTPELYLRKYFSGCLKDGDSICIKRLGGLGDVMWALPVAHKMKQMYPKLKIGFLVNEGHFDLLRNNPYIDELIKFPASVDKLLEYNWHLDYYETIERYNPAEYTESYDIHWKWAFNTLPKEDLMGNVFITDKEREYIARAYPGKYIAVCLNSSNPKRTYFFMDTIIDRILTDNPDIKIIILGQHPQKLREDKRIVNLIGRTTLREVMTFIACAEAVVCSDSGNLHIAGQLGKRGVCLFTTAHESTRMKYYKTIKAVQSPIACAGCVKLGEPCAKEGECMRMIAPETVYKALCEVMACI